MIEVNSLSFSYGNTEILKNLSFSVSEGELAFLLGANGAGKTTLLRCLLGQLKPKSGEVRLAGKDISNLKEKEQAKIVAYIPQFHAPAFSYSVEDMVLMGTTCHLSPFENPGKAEKEAAERAMGTMGILSMKNRDFPSLSGGEQQLTLIARALAQGSRILLMDEPASALDFGNRLRLLEKIQELTAQGYTVLMSAHDPQQALLYADKVLALHAGELVACGSAQDCLDPELMELLYGVHTRFLSTEAGTLIAAL